MNTVLAKLRDRAQSIRRFRCPQDAEHCFLLPWSGQPAGFDFYCPAHHHKGRPFYSLAEAEAAA